MADPSNIPKPVQDLKRHPAESQTTWQEELATTEVSRPVAKAVSILFLLILGSVPVVDTVANLRAEDGTTIFHAWAKIAQVLPKIPQVRQHTDLGEFETVYEDASRLRKGVQPFAQSLVTGLGRFGNHKVALGKDDWLFYVPGLKYLHASEIPEADQSTDTPRKVILDFRDQLEAAGVELVLVPIPDKAMLQPDELTARYDREWPRGVYNNPGYQKLIASLREAGVTIVDPTPGSIEKDAVYFLKQDTHWTPRWMTAVARQVADRLLSDPELRFSNPRNWTAEASQVSRLGDLVDMLSLARAESLFTPQQVEIEIVKDEATNAPFEPSEDAEVLVLGDSFTNIFSDPEMGWGTAAGFGAQLARFLGQPVDVIAVNGGGSTQVRAALARRDAPLAGKKVVVWQLAMRDLTEGEWKRVPIPTGESPVEDTPEQNGTILEIEITTGTPPIAPDDTPYRNAIGYLKGKVLEVKSGTYDQDEILIATPVMKDNKLLPAANWTRGQKLEVEIQPEIPPDVENWTVIDETNEYLLSPVWVE